MNYQTQLQLAQHIQTLRSDPSFALGLADWMDENGINSQQMREAGKYLTLAHSSISNNNSKRKFFGWATFYTKFKEIYVIQHGFSYKIRIQPRAKYATNERIKTNPNYTNLLPS